MQSRKISPAVNGNYAKQLAKTVHELSQAGQETGTSFFGVINTKSAVWRLADSAGE